MTLELLEDQVRKGAMMAHDRDAYLIIRSAARMARELADPDKALERLRVVFREGRLSNTRLYAAFDFENGPSLAEASRSLGLNRTGLHHWLRDRDLLKFCPRVGKERRVPMELIELYERESQTLGVRRVTERPVGYVGYKQAMQAAECNDIVLRRLIKKGHIEVVRKGRVLYYSLEDCQRFALERRSARPTPGLVKIVDLGRECGMGRNHAREWLRRHKHRLTMHTTGLAHGMAYYTDEAGAQAYRGQFGR